MKTMNQTWLKNSLCALGLLVAFAAQATSAMAGTSGGISGTITDSKTGAPIAGARLQISSPSQSVTTTTDARGRFYVYALQPDEYTVSAVKDGYVAASFSGYPVFADQQQVYYLKLTPASEDTSSNSY
jgi:Carboxypeptidase regulatory-like domain